MHQLRYPEALARRVSEGECGEREIRQEKKTSLLPNLSHQGLTRLRGRNYPEGEGNSNLPEKRET